MKTIPQAISLLLFCSIAFAQIPAGYKVETVPLPRGAVSVLGLCHKPDGTLAIATWESKAARDAAAELQGPDVQAIIESQADWVTIQFIGEFEAPEWEVLPDSLVKS